MHGNGPDRPILAFWRSRFLTHHHVDMVGGDPGHLGAIDQGVIDNRIPPVGIGRTSLLLKFDTVAITDGIGPRDLRPAGKGAAGSDTEAER